MILIIVIALVDSEQLFIEWLRLSVPPEPNASNKGKHRKITGNIFMVLTSMNPSPYIQSLLQERLGGLIVT